MYELPALLAHIKQLNANKAKMYDFIFQFEIHSTVDYYWMNKCSVWRAIYISISSVCCIDVVQHLNNLFQHLSQFLSYRCEDNLKDANYTESEFS